MVYIVMNAIPIFAATAASLVFGLLCTRLVASAPEAGTRSTGFLAAAFVAEFWLCAILAGALILAPPEAGEWVMALGSAVVIWIGFVVPALVVTLGYRGVTAGTIALHCGHWLGAMFIMALVLKTIGLVPPPGAPGMTG
ncbi:DUF1761 domain-containing protein [Fulvimarina sp. 2208YS6-2-32]|uniref:DUF1761 domain-containing protein n=1 Tax=Fulvimarina uroteuthidis TaxID=3098149 RepID=A0ABU5I641_9HYPH|nr:DUF1761 domain-containing protein [Fulvimarina sp. 2208YS6-2-32]MDY8110562.1 DUF1761 domain-containing protein [Fulvimarina sp. 2208YS6-2-32]